MYYKLISSSETRTICSSNYHPQHWQTVWGREWGAVYSHQEKENKEQKMNERMKIEWPWPWTNWYCAFSYTSCFCRHPLPGSFPFYALPLPVGLCCNTASRGLNCSYLDLKATILSESASAVRRISFLRPRRREINSARLMNFKLGFQPLSPPPGYSLHSFCCSTSPPPHPERLFKLF